MKTTVKKAQFNQCQATIATFTAEGKIFTIFYSYACPKIVIFPDWKEFRFSFEGSRKAGEKTGSHTTSKQCNKWLGFDHKTLPEYSLKDFEANFFDTRLDRYY